MIWNSKDKEKILKGTREKRITFTLKADFYQQVRCQKIIFSIFNRENSCQNEASIILIAQTREQYRKKFIKLSFMNRYAKVLNERNRNQIQ